jgi:hypothetical protein
VLAQSVRIGCNASGRILTRHRLPCLHPAKPLTAEDAEKQSSRELRESKQNCQSGNMQLKIVKLLLTALQLPNYQLQITNLFLIRVHSRNSRLLLLFRALRGEGSCSRPM